MIDLRQHFSVDDIAWMNAKIKGEYLGIKLSKELSQKEKHARIYKLIERSSRFGFNDLITYMGYTIEEIHLTQGKKIEMLHPINLTRKERISMYTQILEHAKTLRILTP